MGNTQAAVRADAARPVRLWAYKFGGGRTVGFGPQRRYEGAEVTNARDIRHPGAECIGEDETLAAAADLATHLGEHEVSALTTAVCSAPPTS